MWLQSSELMTEDLCLRENTVSVDQWHSWCRLHTVSSFTKMKERKKKKHTQQKQPQKSNTSAMTDVMSQLLDAWRGHDIVC